MISPAHQIMVEGCFALKILFAKDGQQHGKERSEYEGEEQKPAHSAAAVESKDENEQCCKKAAYYLTRSDIDLHKPLMYQVGMGISSRKRRIAFEAFSHFALPWAVSISLWEST